MTDSITFQAIKWEIDESGDICIIYIHGLTSENKRVTIQVPDFKPYVYLELDPKINWSESKLELVRGYLKHQLKGKYPVKSKFVERLKNYYYKKGRFMWMAFNLTSDIKALERIARERTMITGLGTVKLVVHEQRANPILQLLAMRKLKPAGWIDAVRTTKAALLSEYADAFSMSEIQMTCSYSGLSPSKIIAVTNPLVLSYDIECISGDSSGNTFPNGENPDDQIICICATVAYAQAPESEWKTYSLVNECDNKTCPDTLDSKVLHFKNEKALLLGWTNFLAEINPDIITGYNTLSFDDNYMSKRANHLSCWSKFSKMGRLYGKQCKMEERKWNSSAYGDQCFTYMEIPGLIHIDMFPVISKDYTNLSSYTLDAVSEYFLGDHKVDLPPKEMIQRWHNGDSSDMRDIVHYCNKDTVLPLKLMSNMNTWLGLSEMANVMMVQIFDLVTRGQQIRVFSQLYTLAFDLGVVCTDKWTDYKPTDEEKEFVGAVVQDPLVGYWEKVATYDFKSLYPTTIIAYNLCSSTFIPDGENVPASEYNELQISEHVSCEHDKSVRKTKATKIICKEHSYRFYKPEVKKGIVPMLLEYLLDARANTRKEIKELSSKMKTIEGPELASAKLLNIVLDKRQNGYKVAANSCAGYTPIPCKINGIIEYMTIETINGSDAWLKDNSGNEVCVPSREIFVWSDSGWTRLKYIIRHAPKGPLVRVITGTGLIDCTEEHSLLRKNGEPVKPSDLQIGDKLMHKSMVFPYEQGRAHFSAVETDDAFAYGFMYARDITCRNDFWQFKDCHLFEKIDLSRINCNVPFNFLNKPPNIRASFFHGYYVGVGQTNIREMIFTNFKSQLQQTMIYHLLVSLDYPVSVLEWGLVCTKGCHGVKNIIKLSGVQEFVYDIETESHHFAGGVGNMIVHNSVYGGFGSDYSYIPFYPAAASTTAMGRQSIQKAIAFAKEYRKDTVLVYGDTDSCMLHFSTVKDLKECFKICEDLEHKINTIFPKPMYLEMEKIYSKYFLLSKKRYVGYIVNPDNVITSVDKKGVVIKRRDNCGHLRKVYNQLIELIMEKCPRWKIYAYLEKEINNLIHGKVPLEDLVITKSIKDTYKAQNLPHVAVAAKMKERGKYVSSGTRVRYIFVKTKGANDPQYLKAEDPDFYLESLNGPEPLEIDYLYYLEKQLINPIDEALEVKFKVQDVLKNFYKLLKKGTINSGETYFKPRFKLLT